MDRHLNIITLNVPFPPDYGGIIDSFYRIKKLGEAGVKIHLHTFSHRRKGSDVLEKICNSVRYYSRQTGIMAQLSTVPYIVKSRQAPALLEELLSNDYPILFDGLHTTMHLSHPALSGRKKLVRMHNIEHEYYRTLGKLEHNLFKRSFFYSEASKLQRYEAILKHAGHILSVSETDNHYFEGRYGNSRVVPSFHPFEKVSIVEGSGEYVLFHGDLSVIENIRVADRLITNVFQGTDTPLVIAGKNPPAWLCRKAKKYHNIKMVANPPTDEMNSLIMNAHINLLHVVRMNGLKLKLLYSLFAGRHLVINSEMAKGLQKSDTYIVADGNTEVRNIVAALMKKPFTAKMLSERETFVMNYFDNRKGIAAIMDLI